MGKTRPPERTKLQKKQKKRLADQRKKSAALDIPPAQLLANATILLEQGEAPSALELATAALQKLQLRLDASTSTTTSKATAGNGEEEDGEAQDEDADVYALLPALNLLGEINVELGQIDNARECFEQAAEIDEDGEAPEELGGGPEKFMWLAQLSEEGGKDSVRWFQRGIRVLRSQIEDIIDDTDMDDEDQKQLMLEEKRSKLASALCGVAEIYMTDLSFDDKESEAVCEKVMGEAIELAPTNPETLQTCASVRISQQKIEEARKFLIKSLDTWRHLPDESFEIPDYAVRISLVRLLMEVGLEEEAMEVIGRLAQEDDSSVETWYLGGWCLNLLAERQRTAANGHATDADTSENNELMVASRKWLLQCLKLYDVQGYEDTKLQEHAQDLISQLNKVLGEPDEDEIDQWDDVDEDDEEEDTNDMEVDD